MRFCVLLLCAASSLAFASASARAQDDVRARLDQMQNDIQTLSRAVYKGDLPPAAPADPVAPDAAAQVSLLQRVSQLETQLMALTGRVEEQQHQTDTLRQRFEETVSRLEGRLDTPERSGAAGPADASGMPPQPGAAPAGDGLAPEDRVPPDSSDRFTGGTSASPAPSGQGAANADDVAPGAQGQTLGTLTGKAGGQAAPVPGSPDAAYEAAYAHLKNRQYDEAEKAFQAFLKAYATHPLAANATYWLGESFYARGQYDKASRIFAEAYQKYPQSPKAADSLLKLGLSLNGMGKTGEACLTFGQLKKQFPASGPTLSRAAQEAKKAGCKS